MEELLALALLLNEDIVNKAEYEHVLNNLFLKSPDDAMLLYIETAADIETSIFYINAHMDNLAFDYDKFECILMKRLQKYYISCADINDFAAKMYSLWQHLPDKIKHEEPFLALNYAGDPLSWGDEKQSRAIFEQIINS